MPELPRYKCLRTTAVPNLDGTMTDPAWDSAPWTSDFVDIRGGDSPASRFRTRAKLMYDDDFLYVAEAGLNAVGVVRLDGRHSRLVGHIPETKAQFLTSPADCAPKLFSIN